MQKTKCGIILGAVLGMSVSLISPLANALDTEGKILTLRGGGPVAGRLSILMDKVTNVCSNPGWSIFGLSQPFRCHMRTNPDCCKRS